MCSSAGKASAEVRGFARGVRRAGTDDWNRLDIQLNGCGFPIGENVR